jgi:putative ABC transport system permease protein
MVGERYFETLGVPLRRGRTFAPGEWLPGALAAIVNERFVAAFVPDRDPIGQRVRLTPPGGADPGEQWLTIVGVTSNVRQAPRAQPDPVVYLPFRASAPPNAVLLLRTTVAADRAASALREAVRDVDRSVSVDRVMTLAGVRRQATWTTRLSLTLAYGVTLLALVLALVGVHGLAAHVVAQRTPEIAIRMVLGASTLQVARLVVRRLGVQLGVGLAAGMVLVIALRPVFRGIDDPLAVGLAMGAITVAMLGACAAPVRRAVATNSTQALRAE